MQLRRQSSGELVKLAPGKALGVGGEARIFRVADFPDVAAKIYHSPSPERAVKLAAMLSNPPEDPMLDAGHVSIAWPSDLLIDESNSGRVVGFLMPMVKNMYPVIDFYHPKTRRQKHPLFNHHYLMRTARNVAASVGALHRRGYVVGDLNESNILVGETALVTLVDTDSFQVPDSRNSRIYRCRVGKVEFTPPELQKVNFAQLDRKEEHDLFGLAVLFFQLLMEGIHPFAGRHLGKGEPPSLEERIASGSFAYGAGQLARTVPMPTAPKYKFLAPRIQELFGHCFIQGHTTPSQRPTAQDWQKALLEAEDLLSTCSQNDQHKYGNHLASCPWCERHALLGGLDSFPSRRSVKVGIHLQVPKKPDRRKMRDPDPFASFKYEEAVAIAHADIRRRNIETWVCCTVLGILTVGLAGFWFWSIRLFLVH